MSKKAISIYLFWMICELVVNYMEIQDFVELPCISLPWYTWNDAENVLENCEIVLEKCLNFFSGNLYSPCYSDVIMSAMASQITSISIVSPTVCSGADQRKYQSSASLAFVNGIHRYSVDSPHKGPVIQKIFPFDDIVMVACFPYSAFVPLSTRRNRSSYWWT